MANRPLARTNDGQRPGGKPKAETERGCVSVTIADGSEREKGASGALREDRCEGGWGVGPGGDSGASVCLSTGTFSSQE